MPKVLIREGIVFFLILIVLAGIMHPDLFIDPSNRLSLMQEKSNYYHPFIYAFIVYIVLFIFRYFVEKVIYFTNKIKFK